ncbi:MAG: saccharopine dehydrogenase C-terminal domain-containing protein [Bacillota bacterium]|nr:saccharopine dehydrogenase C-terminal domain-containing protein [Bacillota bacterium]
MKIVCLGAVGAMGISASRDLIKYDDFTEIVLADYNTEKMELLAKELNDPRIKVKKFDATDINSVRKVLSGADVFLNSLPFDFHDNVFEAAIELSVSGADLGSFPSPEQEKRIAQAQITIVSGMGATPGITSCMVRHLTEKMQEVDDIEISFGAWRGVAMSPGLLDTCIWELHPDTPERCYYDNGNYVRTPPFGEAKLVDFPEPIGPQTVYVMSHPEAITIPKTIQAKRVFLRGTWPPEVMELFRWLLHYEFLTAEPVVIGGSEVKPLDVIRAHLVRLPLAQTYPRHHYALHVQVTGIESDTKVTKQMVATHPIMEEWGGEEVYGKFVGIPLSVCGQMLAVKLLPNNLGFVAPEAIIPPLAMFEELKKRGFIFSGDILEQIKV